MSASFSPETIAAALGRRVLGQEAAVREMSIALYKKLRGLTAGNILLIGSSGTGKTTLMRSVEAFLSASPELAESSTVVRIHAKILAEESEQSRAGEGVLRRLLARARESAGAEAEPDELLARMRRGIVFVDEVDKIRSHVGGEAHVEGIRAQEALLTLIENESVPFELPDWAGGEEVRVDTSGVLFVCGGAFEGLYDAVFDRLTVGDDRGKLQPVTVVHDGEVHQELQFTLRDWLEIEDLFRYGMTPQFLSRFDARIVLNDLTAEDLERIFVDSSESSLKQAEAYFEDRGLRLAVSPGAVHRIAAAAARQPRLGARALKEIFRRIVGPLEFDPDENSTDGAVVIDEAVVDDALAPGTTAGAS